MIEVQGVRFAKFGTLWELAEVFGRRDYEFGGRFADVVVLDVGANIGDTALFAALNPNVTKIYSYEPIPTTYQDATTNVALNPELANKIELLPYGWSDVDSDVEIEAFRDARHSAVNSLETFFRRSCRAYATSAELTSVVVRTCDVAGEMRRIIDRHRDQPIVLKMDIEGGEYRCFERLASCGLIKYVSIVIVEWHYKGCRSIIDILEANSFIWFNAKMGAEVGMLRAYKRSEG